MTSDPVIMRMSTRENSPTLPPSSPRRESYGYVTFESYGEAKIRHFHQLYDRWLDLA